MTKSTAFANDLQELIFQGAAIAALAGITTLYIGLHTAEPGVGGTQSTNEIAYTSYARKAIPRDNTGFTVTGNAAFLAALAAFVAGTGGSGTATHFSVGTSASGAGYLMHFGAITSPIVCGSGITPILTTATAITED